jgi:hypothetical protein
MQPSQTPMGPAQQGGGKAQAPVQQFTATHNHIYETLRNNLMELYKQGVPGMDEVLHALNKSHVMQLKGMQQQPAQMPQMGAAAGQAMMGGGQGAMMGAAAPQMAMPQQPTQQPMMQHPQMPGQGGM